MVFCCNGCNLVTVCLTSVVLQWIQLFLTKRTQQIANGSQMSATRPLLCGVPQVSVLGLRYLLYNVELGHIVASHGVHLHQYADNGQVYIHVTNSNTVAAIHSFAACISDINDWMCASTLRLNPSKTRFL